MSDEAGSRWEDLTFDRDGRLIDIGGPVEFVEVGPPAPITWTSVMDVGEVFGRPAAVRNVREVRYDLRVASEVFEDGGGWYVNLVGEDQWWAWVGLPEAARPARPARATCWPTRYVWVENRNPGPPAPEDSPSPEHPS